MARKARQRISYVLPLANASKGHRLGVNGLAYDQARSVLYSGGRDGVICAWDAGASPRPTGKEGKLSEEAIVDAPSKKSSYRNQVQAHTHWVNDIVLVQEGSALVSASSDLTVKLWQPFAEDGGAPQTLGLHSDYVKCLAAPGHHANWVASGGLDRKICLWDLNEGSKKLQIDVGEDENNAKGSVYALAVGGGILASGGPESIVRVWDPRTGRRVTKFVGHTDNVRDILISATGDMIMTASSDQTIKVWSVTAGRCMYTLTMHNDSVWSLYSNHPQLSVFYSSDRSGLVAKTDVRGAVEMDDGLCVAVCQEHEGVNKVISNGTDLWTATSSSSINRWADVDAQSEVQFSDFYRHHRASSAASRTRTGPLPRWVNFAASSPGVRQVSLNSILRLSNAASFPGPQYREPEYAAPTSDVKGLVSDTDAESDGGHLVPLYRLPEDTIEGQHGLIKHVMLNDRRRVLTLDTAGEILMWDIIKCVPIQSFGKRHLEDVVNEVNTTETVANWCLVDTRTGNLTCVLEDNHCFDAEMYADEFDLEDPAEFKEDQRINLGKWVLRYLFARLIDEEIVRDSQFRKDLEEGRDQQTRLQRKAPPSIQMPPNAPGWEEGAAINGLNATTRVGANSQVPLNTPGLSIGVATPYVQPHGVHADGHLPTMVEEERDSDKRMSQASQPRSSSERSSDYFGLPVGNPPAAEQDAKTTTATGETTEAQPARTPGETDKDAQPKETSLFGKKFRIPFGGKKIGRSSSVNEKAAAAEEKVNDSDSASRSSDAKTNVIEDNFFGVIQTLRLGYSTSMSDPNALVTTSGITPSPPNETPVLKPPLETAIIIQEDLPESGGIADLYRGTVGTVGEDAELIEKVAPIWLGDLLLRGLVPNKETVKVSFVLKSYEDLLPSISGNEPNSRLNANRMLRAKKIMAYVAERLEAKPEKPEETPMKPEEYLELYCQQQRVPTTMTLATIRSQLWKTSGDVLLLYKSNGKKSILGEKKPEDTKEESNNTQIPAAQQELSSA